MHQFLALSFLLATSLASSSANQDVIKRLEHLEAKVNDMENMIIHVSKSFYSVQNARTFSTGSKTLYTTNKQKGNFETANSTCLHAGGHIPSPAKEVDNKALQSVLERHNERAFVLGSGSDYTNWAAGEPNNADGIHNCAETDQSGKWRAASCEAEHLIVCEFSDS